MLWQPPSKAQYEFVFDCLDRMHKVYLKYHLLYDKEVELREDLEEKVKTLEKEIKKLKK